MLTVKRLLANLIDILMFLIVVVLNFIWLEPTEMWGVVISIVGILFICTVLQWPFMVVSQTIGKAFLGLEIVSEIKDRPISPGVIIQREILTKLIPFYFTCLPMVVGKKGHHDIMSHTCVRSKHAS